MSDKAKFKIKVGETEIELEGSEEKILKQYERVFEWASNQKPTIKKDKPTVSNPTEVPKDPVDEEKRGGPRSATLSPVVDKIIADGYFEHPNSRTLDDVMEEIKRRGYPSTGAKPKGVVTSKLKRLQRAGKVKAVQEGNIWKYWTEA